jgi:transposase InsO family protein
MSGVVGLGPGSRILKDGEAWKVVGFSGVRAMLENDAGRRWAMDLVDLVDSVMVFDDDQAPKAAAGVRPPIDGIPQAALDRAYEVMGHIQEVLCGYPDPTLEGTDARPRTGYDPDKTTLTQRVDNKVKELNRKAEQIRALDPRIQVHSVKHRQLWTWLSRWKESPSVLSLVDKRTIKECGYGDSPERAEYVRKVREALIAVLDEGTDRSSISISEMHRRTKVRLVRDHGAGKVPMMPYDTFKVLARQLGQPRGYFGQAKTRRSIANKPKQTYGQLTATRPGEIIQIDSTRLDVHAIDPATGNWVRVDLTVAIDVFTRQIVALRLTRHSTKGVDAAWLLYDILRPTPLMAGDDPAMKWRFVGVPESVVITCDTSRVERQLANRPVIEPDTVVIDRGRVFVSDAFIDTCSLLGINVILSRPGRPTDKGICERFFRTIREVLVALPGYKGPAVYWRGANVELEAVYTIDELLQILLAWIVLIYQVRPHDGLHLPSAPYVPVSPNMMLEAGLVTAGFLRVPRDPTIAFNLLPVHWVARIHDYGVERRGLNYDAEILRKYERQKSPYGGKHAGKWPLRVDVNDVSVLWFQNPDDGSWHRLPWRGMLDAGDRPFDDDLVSYTKHHLLAQGVTRPSREELGDVLTGILHRLGSGESVSLAEHRAAAKSAHRAAQAVKDREAAEAAATPITEDPASALVGWEPPGAAQSGKTSTPLPGALGDDSRIEPFPSYDEAFSLRERVHALSLSVADTVEWDDEDDEEAVL